MLERHPLLRIDGEVKLPLLTPFNGVAPKEIEEEVERRLKEGFRTFKIKVGKDVEADINRVKAIVSDLRTFTHPGEAGCDWVDVREVATSALRLLSREWKDRVEIQITSRCRPIINHKS